MVRQGSSKQAVARALWLLYYNKELRDKGFISEEEYQRMAIAIKTKYLPSHQSR